MAQAVVVLGETGSVAIVHTPDAGSTAPTSNAADLEKLLKAGFRVIRELALEGGKALLILEKS